MIEYNDINRFLEKIINQTKDKTLKWYRNERLEHFTIYDGFNLTLYLRRDLRHNLKLNSINSSGLFVIYLYEFPVLSELIYLLKQISNVLEQEDEPKFETLFKK